MAEFFSVAQALAEQPGLLAHATPAESFATLYYDLASVTRTFFVDLCDTAETWPDDFQSILRGVRPDEDAIVNFNWDEEVDFFLSTQRDDDGKGGKDFNVVYTRNSWQQDHFLILKPHGSIGWYDVAQGIANPDTYFIAEDRDDRIPRFQKRLIAYGATKALGVSLPLCRVMRAGLGDRGKDSSHSSVVIARDRACDCPRGPLGHLDCRRLAHQPQLDRPACRRFDVAQVVGNRRILHAVFPQRGRKLAHCRGGQLAEKLDFENPLDVVKAAKGGFFR